MTAHLRNCHPERCAARGYRGERKRWSRHRRSPCFDSRIVMWAPVLLFALLLPGSAHSQSRAVITSADVRVEIRKNTDVTVDERVELVLPDSSSSIIARLPTLVRPRGGPEWTATLRIESVVVDGVVQMARVQEDFDSRRVTLLERGTYPPGKHVVRLVYTASSLFTAGGDRWVPPGHNYALRISPRVIHQTRSEEEESLRWGLPGADPVPIQAATVALIVPSDVALNDVIIRPVTESAPTGVGVPCDCKVELSPADHRITVATTRTIEPGSYLRIDMYFPPRSLSPDPAERWRLYAQAHPSRVAWGLWGTSVLAFMILAAGLAGCTRWSHRLRSHPRLVLVFLALCAGIAGVASTSGLNWLQLLRSALQ